MTDTSRQRTNLPERACTPLVVVCEDHGSVYLQRNGRLRRWQTLMTVCQAGYVVMDTRAQRHLFELLSLIVLAINGYS